MDALGFYKVYFFLYCFFEKPRSKVSHLKRRIGKKESKQGIKYATPFGKWNKCYSGEYSFEMSLIREFFFRFVKSNEV